MREKLPDRRFSVNARVVWTKYNGKQTNIVATIGFDANGKPKEIFCADFKAGSDNQAIVMDACILVSRLLQHGDTLDELLGSMCSPPSLLGTIIEVVVRETARFRAFVPYQELKEEETLPT